MQKALTVADDLGNIVSKRVYSGDLSMVDTECARLAAKYPLYSVTKYASDQDPAFVAATYNNPQNIVIV